MLALIFGEKLHRQRFWRSDARLSVRASGDASRKSIAKVAMARRIAVRLYWMWRNGWSMGSR